MFWMIHCGIWNRCIVGFVSHINYLHMTQSSVMHHTAYCNTNTNRKPRRHFTHWVLNKMADILQMKFPDAFTCMKIIVYWLKFHWSVFPIFKTLLKTIAISWNCTQLWSCDHVHQVLHYIRTPRDFINSWYQSLLIGWLLSAIDLWWPCTVGTTPVFRHSRNWRCLVTWSSWRKDRVFFSAKITFRLHLK